MCSHSRLDHSLGDYKGIKLSQETKTVTQNQAKSHLNQSFLHGELTCGVTIACTQVLSAIESQEGGTKTNR